MRISVLVSARRNSKYLAKFIHGLRVNTANLDDIEVLVMLNQHDNWNNELVDYYESFDNDFDIRFFREDMRLGRAGLHEYYNVLVKHATGDWFIYFCEDHFINTAGWDGYIISSITGETPLSTSRKSKVAPTYPLNHKEPFVLVPKFDNIGSVNHIVSRGFVEAMGGKIGRHGWIDSYINDLINVFPERVLLFNEEMFHDFTHDQPNPMSDAHMQSVDTTLGSSLPKYESDATREMLEQDREKIRKALEGIL